MNSSGEILNNKKYSIFSSIFKAKGSTKDKNSITKAFNEMHVFDILPMWTI